MVVVLAFAVPPVALASVPGTTCDVFPADNVWNMDVSGLPVHRRSAAWKVSAHAGSALLHPDFGADPYGFPFAVTDASTPTTSVHFAYADESDRPARHRAGVRDRSCPPMGARFRLKASFDISGFSV
jgi:hypothetical protein